jgi:HEPN domain-containing protein
LNNTEDTDYWLRIAEEDWIGAQNEIAASQKIWRHVCLFSHSSSEKFLKAFITSNGTRTERIHDLDRLLNICIQFDPSLDILSAETNRLCFFAVDSRYPEDESKYDEESARLAATAAETIRNAILLRISKQS